MSLLQPKRRGFLLGAGALLMAPAIVRASSLMPVSVHGPHAVVIGDKIAILGEWGNELGRHGDLSPFTSLVSIARAPGFEEICQTDDGGKTWRVISRTTTHGQT